MGQFEITEDDIGLQVMPLCHVIVNGCINPCLAAGATVVLMRRFEEVAFMKTISEEKVSFIAVVPPFLFAWVMKVPEAIAYDVTHVRLFVTAATTFPDDLKRSVLKYMPKAKLLYVYGLTESSGGNATALLHGDAFRKTGSIGMPTRCSGTGLLMVLAKMCLGGTRGTVAKRPSDYKGILQTGGGNKGDLHRRMAAYR